MVGDFITTYLVGVLFVVCFITAGGLHSNVVPIIPFNVIPARYHESVRARPRK